MRILLRSSSSFLLHLICLLDWILAVAASPPNVVFVLADDYGYNDIGYHGSEIQTPTLDKISSKGLRLENYYVQPICTPTRSQIMSGRYQIHTGLQHSIIHPGQPNALPLNSPTLADKMKEAGYSTHMVGKWHLGFYKKEYLPWKRGFDTFFGYLNGCEDYYQHTRGYSEDINKPFLDLRNEHGPVRNESGHYSAHLFTQKAIDVINNHNEKKPLFLFLAYQSVHTPLQVPDRYLRKYKNIKNEQRRKYAGMVSAMDEGVRNLTNALKSKGLWSNTVFIFSTDNGGTSKTGNNFPLRGHKDTLWEGGLHGVGFVAGGVLNRTRTGKVSHDLIHVSDWYPTIVGLARGSLNGCLPLDGINQWKTINMGKPSERSIVLHNIDPLFEKKGKPLYPDTFDTRTRAAIRVGSYKLITGDPGSGEWTPPPKVSDLELSKESNSTGGNSSLYFTSENQTEKNVWLFNITADPTEHHDLSDDRPEVVRAMLELLRKINDTAVPARYPKRDPQSNPALHGGVWGPWQ